MSELLKVGQIVTSHGLKGQVKVDVLTDFHQRLDKGQKLKLKEQWVTVEASQWQNKRLLMRLSGVNNIETAKSLQWEFLYASDEQELVLDDDEYRVDDVIGLKVVTVGGKELGKVERVDPYPAQDILIIGDIMIPFVEQFVTDIDFDSGVITVDLIPGMLGEEDDEAEPI